MSNRRSFIRWGILGFFFSRLFSRKFPVLAQGNSLAGYTKFATIDELDKKGFLLNEDFSLGSIMVVKQPDKAIVAVDPTCPHSGCIVDWKKNSKSFICPCHNSKFKADGSKISGIASSGLKKYEVKVDKKNIWVKKK
jgi:cytochrome b6-f complex iron-sulfur subunit